MTKRCIGIDIGSNRISAVQLSLEDGDFCVEKIFDAPTRRNTDSPAQLLHALFHHHEFDCNAEVAISIPHESVYFRTVQADAANLVLLRNDTAAALENELPLTNDQIIAQTCSERHLPDNTYSVLAAAMEKTSLQKRLNILAEAKIKPCCIEPAILAVHRIVALNHPQAAQGRAVIAYIDDSHLILAVTENNDIIIVRNVPITIASDNDNDLAQHQITQLLARETEITWQKTFGEQLPDHTTVYIAARRKVTEDFEATITEALPCTTLIVNPYKKLKYAADKKYDYTLLIPAGLALSMLMHDQAAPVNFLQAETADTQHKLDTHRELLTCGMLVAAIAVVACVGLFTRLAGLEAINTNITNETRNVFHAALPHVQNIAIPLVQLDEELQSLQKNYELFAPFGPTNRAPLKVLDNITQTIPSDMDIKVDEMYLSNQIVRIRAKCDSFDTAYQWESLLQKVPGFELAEVQDDIEKQSETEVVKFTILIMSKTGQEI